MNDIEEQLALDAMRADNIIDLETRQQYEAIHDAAMGDYMGTDDNGYEWCSICGGGPDSGDPCDWCEEQEKAARLSDATGYASLPDMEDRPVVRYHSGGSSNKTLDVVPTPTSPERMRQIAYEITGIAGRLRPGPEANRLYDLAFEIDQLFLNQK